ncbi:hypothetical protein CPB83DRAFT_764334 [Crepidotus variabilis]|uniref:DUF6699 domain-containing protein n=1 Tax=Crepidotus variabilis TaxID=179855 RepID=A0A9P6JQM5_9AGAR|nr:hypothetical protein CPB83DRAFT_764334 [Crepidotus variabilis]
MAKRVHFAQTATVYSDASASSSPCLSVSSLPSTSSPELPSPPPEEEDYEYYPTNAYPIHFLLAFSPFSEPAIPWDLSYPAPKSYMGADGYDLLTVDTLVEPATSPPLGSLLITHPNLKWNVEILPSDHEPGAFVSVNDVLVSLYRELRLAIHPLEYAELPEGEVRSSVDAAYYARCGRIRDTQIRMLEEKKGIKKIDLLMGRSRFLGLSGTHTSPDVWELNLA